jgi:GTPase
MRNSRPQPQCCRCSPVSKSKESRFGFVAIVGRPNVGKSTLLNALVGEKLSIVTPKPHTTRHRILGVLNAPGRQAVFIDTPGHARRTRKALHRLMARVIHQALEDCDLALLVIDAARRTREDQRLFEILADRSDKVILVLNKIDLLHAKSELLPMLDNLKHLGFLAYVPVSAAKSDKVDELAATIFAHLPTGEPMFPAEMLTDRNLEFRAAELIREKLLLNLHQEIPYGLTVEIEHLARTDEGRWLIHGLIWVERESHKAIVIGKDGRVLKEVGRAARKELCGLVGERVHLELWVKVREHWSDSERELQRLGFDLQ